MARVQTAGSFQGGGPYRKPDAQRSYNPILASLKGKLTWNNRKQRAIRNQIDELHRKLESLVMEEKQLLDELQREDGARC